MFAVWFLCLSLVVVFPSRQVEQLYLLSLCSKEDCFKILSRHQWDLQQASRTLIRLSREERPGPSDRPQISAERRVWGTLWADLMFVFSNSWMFDCFFIVFKQRPSFWWLRHVELPYTTFSTSELYGAKHSKEKWRNVKIKTFFETLGLIKNCFLYFYRLLSMFSKDLYIMY